MDPRRGLASLMRRHARETVEVLVADLGVLDS